MNFSSAPPFSKNSLWATLAGGGGGMLSFIVGELVGGFTDKAIGNADVLKLILSTAIWSGALGLVIGLAILIYDNLGSLRGQWHRDVAIAVPLFFALSFVGGAAGQIAYSGFQNSLTRGIGWSLIGASTGIGIGLLRRDMTQAGRGALGGAIGGFLGGFIFDGLTLISYAGNGSFSRFVGQIIMGALIALLMRVVQDALKNAWLLGISTGPYEGKEYPLNTARVTVGREDSNAIALYRETEMPAQLGALVYQGETWIWQGASVPINGVPQSQAALQPGDTLQLGATRFRFQNRSSKVAPSPVPYSPVSQYPTAAAPPAAYAPPVPMPPTVADPNFATPPAAGTVIAAPSFALVSLSGQLIHLPDLSSPLSVGRVAGNGVVLSDPAVSSNHARIQVVSGSFCVTDLGSTNGTFVNGAKLLPQTPQRLKVGDRVRFGSLEYTVRAG